MTTHRRWFPVTVRRVIPAITVLTLLVSGCSARPDDLPSVLASQGDGGGDEKDPSQSEPIEFGEKPLWDKESKDSRDRGFVDSRVIGGRIVYSRIDDNARSHITVADAKTGKTKWKLSEGDAIAGSGGLSADFLSIHPLGESATAKALIVEYLEPATLDDGSPGEESGIAAVSVKTGELLWRAPVITGREYGHVLFVDASSSEHVAVGVSEVGDDPDIDDLAVVSTKQHEVLWRKKDLRASAVVGDTVLARKPTDDDKTSDLSAMKAADGDERWKLDSDDDPKVLEHTTEAVIVSVSGAVTVVDPKSGDAMAEPKVSATECHFDGESTLACQAQDDNDEPQSAVYTIVLSDDSAKAKQVPKSDAYTLTGMYEGRIFVERWIDDGTDYRVLDPEGDTIADKLPGRFIDGSDHYAVFTIRDTVGSDVMLVHDVKV